MRTFAVLLVAGIVSGCAVPSTVPRDLARAKEAYSAGHMWTANRLLRAAAHGGSLGAQMELASPYAPMSNGGGRSISEVDALFSPFPGPRERAVWARTARANAERLAAAGDPDGHLVLGLFSYLGPDLTSHGKPGPDSLAQVRRHYEAAVALGSKRAHTHLAHHVWMSDGLLASEPFFRASVAVGNTADARMLSHIALERPLLERGLRSRDRPGDLSMIDIVGSIRVLRDAGDAESLDEMNTRVGAMREQARAGNAEADSLLTVLGAAGLLG